MKLDDICNQVYVVALNEAKIQNHEYITPEHYLYCALLFNMGKEILEKSGGNIRGIKDDLGKYFEERIPKNVSDYPIDSLGFVRMFELASTQAHSSGRDIIKLGNVIAAIFNLQESFAAFIMLKNGVNRLTLLKVISHDLYADSFADAEQDTIRKHDDIDFLRQFAVNLTERAAKRQLDPLIGREDVIERTIQVLSRRLKNNPIHVGDPGVGKTAVVEGLATRIVDKRVPKLLQACQIFHIDIGTVVAGTKYRGDFEERLIKIIDIISKEKKPIVYIDEIHTVVGAGAASGGNMDATSILKPYLARGDIRFIGSTTFDEYKKYFEKDKALSRRFQRIDISEPSIDECFKILSGLKERYEAFHNVIYPDAALSHICELTSKYMLDRFLPDKAIDVMDETGAYLRTRDDMGLKKVVTIKDIDRTIAGMARIPESSISLSEMDRLKNLEQKIKEQVFGQNAAIEEATSAIKASRSGLSDPDRPVACLMFVGPSGVGKTEIAKQLASCLGIKLERFDMSEYQEKHSVARLIGAPPGYVGYDEGGLLTEAIRKTPHCVLLLDEIEKAHSDIYNVMLQIMDYGSLTDNIGKKADFRNVIIIMTSNAGAKDLNKRLIGFDEDKLNTSAIGREVEKTFNPEFRNRLDAIITFNSLSMDMAEQITQKTVNRLAERMKKKEVNLKCSKRALEFISRKGLSDVYGAREIIRMVEKVVKKKLVDDVLFGDIEKGSTAVIDLKNDEITVRIRRTDKN